MPKITELGRSHTPGEEPEGWEAATDSTETPVVVVDTPAPDVTPKGDAILEEPVAPARVSARRNG